MREFQKKNQSPSKKITSYQSTEMRAAEKKMVKHDSEPVFSDLDSNKSQHDNKKYVSLRAYLQSKVANPIVEAKKEDLIAARKI